MLLNRREIIVGGTAVAGATQMPLGNAYGREIFIKPFAGSRTLVSFVSRFRDFYPDLPDAWGRLIDAELERTDMPPISETEERSHSAFLARLALWVIAPRALRRAGFEALAALCETESTFRPGGSAALAQHVVGRDLELGSMPLAWTAYGTCSFTAICASYAGHDDLDAVVDVGDFCARAIGRADDDADESSWSWLVAALAIEAAPKRAPFHSVVDCMSKLKAEADRMSAFEGRISLRLDFT